MTETGAGRFGPYEVATTTPSPTGEVVARDDAGRAVWLRPLADAWSADPARRAAFDADQARLAAVDAPGTVRSESIVTDGGRAALVLDAPSATLVDLTTGGRRYPSHQAARLGVQLADALAAAHRAGVVHGGLTPDAVVQSADGHLQLRHFGFATDPLAVTDVATWTAYAAPEQLLDGPPDARSDLYALGGLLFLLLTGGPPFPDFETDTLRARKLEEASPAPSRDEPMVPAALDGLVQRLLARDPARRPDRAEDVSAELRRLTQPADDGTPTRRISVVDEIVTAPPERTSAWPYVALILGALLVVAVIIAFVVANDDDGPARVTVPSVVGQPAADAAATLTRRHLDVTTVNQADATVAAGSVSAQDPAAGARVRRNRVVVLTVSTGAPAVTPVPIPVPVAPSTSSSTSTSSTTSTSTTTSTTTIPTTAPPP
jgi:eukaryotic-like serine/threonine-protein kinase